MSDIFGCLPRDITPDSTPDTIEAWDSLRMLDLLLIIEQEAGVEIDPDRVGEMITVPAILEIVNSTLEARG
ncbi:MAG: acyl carrier protein [Phenylobacterium zucineum]|nr:MAG: acyl carrier protein [Phenylobacterium zucineum]